MKRYKAIMAVVALAAMSSGLPAAAQSTQPMSGDRPHFYAGGSVGSNDDEEIALKALGGYQINRNFSAELGFSRLGDMNVNGTRFNPRALEVVGLGAFPVGPVSLYGKLGVFQGMNTPGSNNTDLTYGFGVLYEVARNIAVRGEWQRYDGLKTGAGDHDADVMSIGAIFRFN